MGIHIGNLDNELCVIGNIMESMTDIRPVKDMRVNLIDLENYGLTGDEADNIHDFFWTILTPDQEVAILNEDYKSLVSLI